MVSSTSNRTKVFISYSHKDARYLQGLLPHLEYLEKNKLIDFWADTKIKPGERWQDEIELALASTKAAILLISVYFLISPFIERNELPPLLAAAEVEGVTILPVILRPCTIPKSLSRFQAVNSPSKPLVKMKGYERDEIWVKVADATRNALNTVVDKMGTKQEGISPAQMTSSDTEALAKIIANHLVRDDPQRILRHLLFFAGLEEVLVEVDMSGAPINIARSVVAHLKGRSRLVSHPDYEVLGLFLLYLRDHEELLPHDRSTIGDIIRKYQLVPPQNTDT